MNNINKQILPLFGTPLDLKVRVERKAENTANMSLQNQLIFQNLSQIEQIEYIVSGLETIRNQSALQISLSGYKEVIKDLQKSKSNSYIDNSISTLNSELDILLPFSLSSFSIYDPLNTPINGQSNRSIRKANRLFESIASEILNKGLILSLELDKLIVEKKIENLKLKINNLKIQNKANILENNVLEMEKEKLDLRTRTELKFISLANKTGLNNTNIIANNSTKIEQTVKNILKKITFDNRTDTFPINSLPGNQLMPRINQYIKSISMYNMKRKGTIMVFSQIIGYSFNSNKNMLLKNIYKFLASSFRTMHCLISKPVFVVSPDKIEIQLFYYFLDPIKVLEKEKWKLGQTKKTKLLPSISSLAINNSEQNSSENSQVNKLSQLIKFHFKLINIRNKKIFIWRKKFIIRNAKKFQLICLILSRFFKKPVELNLIRLRYPYKDSNILVNFLAIMIRKTKIRIFIKKLFRWAIIKNPLKIQTDISNSANKSKSLIIPAFLSGMKLRIAGRLLTQRVIPRKTVKTTIRGALATGKVNFSDSARFTSKNKRGSFSITVSSGQNFK